MTIVGLRASQPGVNHHQLGRFRRRPSNLLFDDEVSEDSVLEDSLSDIENQPPTSENVQTQRSFRARVLPRNTRFSRQVSIQKPVPFRPHHSLLSTTSSRQQRTILGELSLLDLSMEPSVTDAHPPQLPVTVVRDIPAPRIPDPTEVEDYDSVSPISPSRNTPVDGADVDVEPSCANGTQPVSPAPETIFSSHDTSSLDHEKEQVEEESVVASPAVESLEGLLADLRALKLRTRYETAQYEDDVHFAIRRSKLLVSKAAHHQPL